MPALHIGVYPFGQKLSTSAMLPENCLTQKVAIYKPFMQQWGQISEL
jgi:hypothetical protein